MSQTLTEDAPSTDVAADLTEEPAPAPGGEVTVGSAGGDDYVEKSRFNGLMSTFNKTKDEYEGKLAAAQAEIESLRAAPERQETLVPDTGDIGTLQEKVDQLTQMLYSERLENIRSATLDKYPEARPFADMIVGSTPDEIEDVARTIADRLKGITGEVSPEEDGEVVTDAGGAPEVVIPPAPAAPVIGGGTTSPDDGAVATRKVEALASGNMAAFLEAAWEEQTSSVPPNVA